MNVRVFSAFDIRLLELFEISGNYRLRISGASTYAMYQVNKVTFLDVLGGCLVIETFNKGNDNKILFHLESKVFFEGFIEFVFDFFPSCIVGVTSKDERSLLYLESGKTSKKYKNFIKTTIPGCVVGITKLDRKELIHVATGTILRHCKSF